MNRERSTRGSNAKKYNYQIESPFENVDRPLKEIYDYNFTYQTELLRTKFVQNLQRNHIATKVAMLAIPKKSLTFIDFDQY